MFIRLIAAMVSVVALATSPVLAADKIRLAVQKTGSLAWELEIIRTYGLDKKADLELQLVELATTEAGKIALKGGSADVMVSDWLYAARERSLGDTLVYYPYTTTLGAVMAPANSTVTGVASLKGRKIGVAGGPLDKSWLLLQALSKRSGVDLKKDAQPVYGAPPLLSEKLVQGELDTDLTFWNFCAELESRGQKRAIDMNDVLRDLGTKGAVSMIGYVFDGKWAEKNRSAIDRFLVISKQAKEILAKSEDEWRKLAPRIGTTDANLLKILQKRYTEGIPSRSSADEAQDAKSLYRILAEIGGQELVGPAKELDPGTYYIPATGG